MTPLEIIAECDAALAPGDPAPGHVVLCLPKGVSMRAKGLPRGELLCENPGGDRVVRYDAKRLKAAVLKAYLPSPSGDSTP
jgi:hypothetical protein